MKNSNSKLVRLVLTAMFIAIGIILPFFTGQIKQIGNMLLPMHLPVMLCGLICGPWYGLAAGAITPLLRSLIFGMPKLFPSAAAMIFELAVYGGMIGLLYSRSKWKCLVALLRSMVIAMICGRVVWGAVMTVMLGIGENGFTFGAFLSGAVTTALPGIILQFILIPTVMTALGRTKIMTFAKKKKELITDGK